MGETHILVCLVFHVLNILEVILINYLQDVQWLGSLSISGDLVFWRTPFRQLFSFKILLKTAIKNVIANVFELGLFRNAWDVC